MLLIDVRQFRVGSRVLLDCLRIEVPAGQVHLLKGPNGCGKSLLLDAVTGVHRSTGVRVSVAGRSLQGLTTFGRWRAGLRRLFQTPTLPAAVTVEQALERSGFMTGLTGTLSSCGIRPGEGIGVHSFGQRRLVELVAALSSGRACLLDEPFAGLSTALAPVAEGFIRLAAARDCSILVIDHLSAQRTSTYADVHNWKTPSAPPPDGAFPEDDCLAKMFPRSGSGGSDVPPWRIRTFRVGERAVLRDVVIDLPQGTLLLLTGGNGTGKSTLLRALARCQQPWAGVTADIAGGPAVEDMHLSPQPPKLVDDLTVRENLRIMLRVGSKRADKPLRSAGRLLLDMGLPASHLGGSRAEVLSGGESGVVSLVGACLSPAQVLLFDEPFESLSPEGSERASVLLRAACRAGKSVIASTHSPALLQLTDPSGCLDLSGGEKTGSWSGTRLS